MSTYLRESAAPHTVAVTQWPHIERHLRSGKDRPGLDFVRWASDVEPSLSQLVRARAWEEWASYFEWLLVLQEPELAKDPGRRWLRAEWTDDMAYCCRRTAAYARGEDPGEWVRQCVRRPDLHPPRTPGSLTRPEPPVP